MGVHVCLFPLLLGCCLKVKDISGKPVFMTQMVMPSPESSVAYQARQHRQAPTVVARMFHTNGTEGPYSRLVATYRQLAHNQRNSKAAARALGVINDLIVTDDDTALRNGVLLAICGMRCASPRERAGSLTCECWCWPRWHHKLISLCWGCASLLCRERECHDTLLERVVIYNQRLGICIRRLELDPRAVDRMSYLQKSALFDRVANEQFQCKLLCNHANDPAGAWLAPWQALSSRARHPGACRHRPVGTDQHDWAWICAGEQPTDAVTTETLRRPSVEELLQRAAALHAAQAPSSGAAAAAAAQRVDAEPGGSLVGLLDAPLQVSGTAPAVPPAVPARAPLPEECTRPDILQRLPLPMLCLSHLAKACCRRPLISKHFTKASAAGACPCPDAACALSSPPVPPGLPTSCLCLQRKHGSLKCSTSFWPCQRPAGASWALTSCRPPWPISRPSLTAHASPTSPAMTIPAFMSLCLTTPAAASCISSRPCCRRAVASRCASSWWR